MRANADALNDLIAEFLESTDRADAALDRALNRLDTMNSRLARVRKETRETAQQEAAAGEAGWPFRTRNC